MTRAYINVTGNISHWISFRITPDVVRVAPIAGPDGPLTVPGITGTLTYRLKYAYGQINFDDLGNNTVDERDGPVEGLLVPTRHAADAGHRLPGDRSIGTASRAPCSPTAKRT